MVRKLYKHEFLAWLRVMTLIYSITLLTAIFLRVIVAFETDSIYYQIISTSGILLWVVGMLATLAAPFIFGIVRFYKNLFSGQGYLTFTLPVRTTTHLWVKTLTTFSFCIASFIVCFLSFCVVTSGDLLTEIWKAAVYLWKDIPQKYVGHVTRYILEGGLMVLAATFSSIMLYNFCLCVGQLAKKNRILLSIGVYFGVYTVSQFLSTVAVIVVSAVDLAGNLQPLFDFIDKEPLKFIHIALWIAIGIYLVISAIFWLICRTILRKKLNIE